jgi:hypothetical protein
MPVGIKTFVIGARFTASVRDLLRARAKRDRRTVAATITMIVEDALGCDVPAATAANPAAASKSLVALHDQRAMQRDADEKREAVEREVLALIDQLATKIVGIRTPRRVATRAAVRSAYMAGGESRTSRMYGEALSALFRDDIIGANMADGTIWMLDQ